MDDAILIIWWIGLIGALLATLVILKEVVLVLKSLRNILRLAELTRDAARGLVRHVQAVDRLAEVDAPARHLHAAMNALSVRATTLAQTLAAITHMGKKA